MERHLVAAYTVQPDRDFPQLSPEAVAQLAGTVADTLHWKVQERWRELEEVRIATPNHDRSECWVAEVSWDEFEPVPGTERPEILSEIKKLEAETWKEELPRALEAGLAALDLVPLYCGKCRRRMWVAGEELGFYEVLDPWGEYGGGTFNVYANFLDCPFCRADRGGRYPLRWDREQSGPLPPPKQ